MKHIVSNSLFIDMKAQFCKKAESDDSDHITLNITICAANELIINDLNHTFPSKVSVNETATKALFEKNKNFLRNEITTIIVRMYFASSLGKICNIIQ